MKQIGLFAFSHDYAIEKLSKETCNFKSTIIITAFQTITSLMRIPKVTTDVKR